MKLQNKRKLAAAVALTALTTPLAAARADDIAAEIRELKEQVKQLEPLKARLKQLEAEVQRRDASRSRRKPRSATLQSFHNCRRRRHRWFVRTSPVRRHLRRFL
jgi:type II secretory pathway component PulJ